MRNYPSSGGIFMLRCSICAYLALQHARKNRRQAAVERGGAEGMNQPPREKRRACSGSGHRVAIDGGEPVLRVEGAAHAQRHGSDVHDLVGGHLFLGFCCLDFGSFFMFGVGQVRPFCLASVCRTGY